MQSRRFLLVFLLCGVFVASALAGTATLSSEVDKLVYEKPLRDVPKVGIGIAGEASIISCGPANCSYVLKIENNSGQDIHDLMISSFYSTNPKQSSVREAIPEVFDDFIAVCAKTGVVNDKNNDVGCIEWVQEKVSKVRYSELPLLVGKSESKRTLDEASYFQKDNTEFSLLNGETKYLKLSFVPSTPTGELVIVAESPSTGFKGSLDPPWVNEEIEPNGVASNANSSQTVRVGVKITLNGTDKTLRMVTVYPGTTATKAYLQTADGGSTIASASITDGNAIFNNVLSASTSYRIVVDSEGAAFERYFNGNYFTIARDNPINHVILNWVDGIYNNNSDRDLSAVQILTFGENPDANVTFNVQRFATSTHLSAFNIDCNVNAYDLSGQNSPVTIDFNKGVYSCTFSKSGYDSNTMTVNANANQTVSVFLTKKLLTADFAYSYRASRNYLDQENGLNSVIVDFNDLSTLDENAIVDWNWFVNGVLVSTDQNTSHAFTAIGDYNVLLRVRDSNNADSNVSKTVSIYQSPQGLSLDYNVLSYNQDVNVFFNLASSSTDLNSFNWGMPDSNRLDRNFFYDFNGPAFGMKNICVTVKNTANVAKVKCRIFYVTKAIVKVPKDEYTSIALSPFRTILTGLTFQDYNNQSADVNVFVFSSTVSGNNVLRIDYNSVPPTYFSRYYSFSHDANLHVIQPYLVNSTNGIATTLLLFDSFTRETLAGIKIDIQKNLSGGLTTVQSLISDAAGSASASFILNDTYYLNFYDSNNNLITTKEVRPISATLYIFLGVSAISSTQPTYKKLTPLFFPETAKAGTVNWTVVGVNKFYSFGAGLDNWGYSVNSMTFKVLQKGSVLASAVDASAPFRIDLNVDANKFVVGYVVIVITEVQTTDGNYSFQNSYYVSKSGLNWLSTISQFQGQNVGAGGSLIIALLGTLLIVGFFASKVTFDYSALAFVSLIVLGGFTLIGFVPWTIYAMSLVAGVFGWIVFKRL